ncbi:hypothetical protein P7L78_22025 [Tistrella bauzanensis]|uniref:hypothetical protein n=1 Tax=Tistrella TaxID=171436 RepID=UPI0031F65238
MAARGRKPLPPEVHVARGTVQPSRDLHEMVQVPEGEVIPPEGLPATALAIWDDLAPQCFAAGTLRPADSYAFGQLCVMLAELQRAWSDPQMEAAPAAYVGQMRLLAEGFGVAGIKSRVVGRGTNAKDGGGPTRKFGSNGRR